MQSQFILLWQIQQPLEFSSVPHMRRAYNLIVSIGCKGSQRILHSLMKPLHAF